MIKLYRHVERGIRHDILREQLAGYGGEIVSTLRRQWTWSHFKRLTYIDDAPILYAGQKHETVEMLDLKSSGIRVASYWTEVLPRKELERKLHEAVRLARARLGESAASAGGAGEVHPPWASVHAASVVGATAVGGVSGGDLRGAVA